MILRIFNFWNFQSLEFSILGIFNFWNFQSLEFSILGIFSFWNFPFLGFSILGISDFWTGKRSHDEMSWKMHRQQKGISRTARALLAVKNCSFYSKAILVLRVGSRKTKYPNSNLFSEFESFLPSRQRLVIFLQYFFQICVTFPY